VEKYVGVGICDEWCGWEYIYAKLPFQGSKTTPEHTYDDLF
jgi:hypothetical protein